jgi:hypothetical protein
MRFRLRTLLIVLAVAPPVLAGAWMLGTTEPGYLILALTVAIAVYVTVEAWLLSPRMRPR